MILNWKKFNENVENYSQYSREIDKKLKKYAEKTGDDWTEIKKHFMDEADPHNMKPPYEVYDIYFKLVDEFLESESGKEDKKTSKEDGYDGISTK